MGTSNEWQCNKQLTECLAHMFEEGISTDVTFLVGEENQSVHAHKFILISRSPVFFAMFEGPLSEKGKISVPDIEIDIFVEFLRYLYTDDIKLTCNNVTYIMYISKKYCVDLLAQECRKFLENSMTPEDACPLLEHAHMCSEDELATRCKKFIFKNPKTCLKSSGFTDLCSTCVISITDSDDLNIAEEEVYRAVLRWAEAECRRQKLDVNDTNRRQVLGDVIYTVRFPCMDEAIFKEEVLNSDVLSSDEMIQIQRVFNNKPMDQSDGKFKSTRRHKINEVQRVVRCTNSPTHNHYWRVCLGRLDAIAFRLSDEACFHGIGVYGAKEGSRKYHVNLTLYDQNDEILSHVVQTILTDQSADVFDVKIDNAVKLLPGSLYTVTVEMNRPKTKRGVCGVKEVSIDGIDVTFMSSKKDTNGTTVDTGQIPCLLLSKN